MAAKDNLSRKIIKTFTNKISDNSLVASLQSEFGEDAYKLAPYILKSIRYHCNDHWEMLGADGKGAMGAYFDMLRGWMMPEMYDRGTKHDELV